MIPVHPLKGQSTRSFALWNGPASAVVPDDQKAKRQGFPHPGKGPHPVKGLR